MIFKYNSCTSQKSIGEVIMKQVSNPKENSDTAARGYGAFFNLGVFLWICSVLSLYRCPLNCSIAQILHQLTALYLLFTLLKMCYV